mmetsp:Transcript_38478/g.86768  ORF Transcript_38478/g.86768 Transcript_38478/m.86768 type:complete len:330 (+) Transcript_38478:77-1066(+)
MALARQVGGTMVAPPAGLGAAQRNRAQAHHISRSAATGAAREPSGSAVRDSAHRVGLLALTAAAGARFAHRRACRHPRGTTRGVRRSAALLLSNVVGNQVTEAHPEGAEADLRQRWGTHSLTPTDIETLQSGQPVQKQQREGTMGSGLVVFEVAAPPSVVLDCLGNFEDYPQMIPVVRRAEVLSRSPTLDGGILARLNYRISRLWISLSVVHVVDTIAGVVRFGLDTTSSRTVLQEADGFWQVEQAPGDHPGRSRVWLRVSLRASSLLPHWIIDYAAERALRRATSWLKPYTEQLWRERQVSQLWGEERAGARKELSVSPAQQLRPSAA